MTASKKIPRIQSISKVEGFRVYCLFNTGEERVVNFEKLFEEWKVKPGDVESALLDVGEFQKVKLRDGVLSWENAKVALVMEDGKEENLPYEIDPVVLYGYSEQVLEAQEEHA